MEKKLRKSGIAILGDMPWGTHFCQFYQTREDLIDILVPYFKAGLENKEFCMWVTAEPLSEREAAEAMRNAVPDFDHYLKRGQIEIIPHTDWYLKGGSFDSRRVLTGWVDKLNQALTKGFEGLRLTGNTFWLEKEGWRDFLVYEDEVNSVIGSYKMIAICTYSLDKCRSAEVIDVVNTHQFALAKREGKWELIESSERKRAEEAVRESEARYRSLFVNMIDGFAYHKIVLDEKGQPVDYVFLEVNSAFERLTGLKRDALVGKGVREVLPGIEKDPADWIGTYGKVALTGKEIRFEQRSEALHKWYSVSAYSPMKGYFAAIFEDITERKQAEELLLENEGRLKRSQEIAHLGSWELDVLNNILTWSDEVYRIFGLQPQAFGATYEAFLEAVHPDDRAAVNAAYAGSLREGRDTYEIEHRVVRKSTGEVRIVHEKCEHFRDESGRIIRSVGMVHDITERKQAEEEIRKLNEELQRHVRQLEESNKELDAFSYSVSHDLRSPLRSVAGFSQVLLDDYAGKLDAEGRDALDRINAAVRRMGQLIDDLLNLSRLARTEMKRTDVDLSGMARDIAGSLKKTQPEREVAFVIAGGLRARADERLLRVAMENLLSNAWKFTSGRPRARIELGVIEQDGQPAYFVRDDGVGFDMAYAGKLFGPFQRLHSAGEFPGAGIGLATVQRVVHRHGGRVWIEGEVEKGATVYFTLG